MAGPSAMPRLDTMAAGPNPRGRPGLGGGRWRRRAHEGRRGNETRPYEHREAEGGAPPVHLRDEPCRERRHGHRRDADADRDQRHGEAAVFADPAHDGGNHRREEAADGDAYQEAEAELELERGLRMAREEEA